MAKRAFHRFHVEFEKLNRAAQNLSDVTGDPIDRGLFWSSILKHNKNATGAIIRVAGLMPEARPLHHRMKNEQRRDGILAYLLHARNAEDHADERGDQIANPTVDAQMRLHGGAIVLGENSSVNFVNCSVNGFPLDGQFSVVGGVQASTVKPVFPFHFGLGRWS